MTGWRLGWMLVPEDLRRPVDVLTGNFTICPPVLTQYAAVAAFTPESYAELDGHVARYRDNRSILLDALPRLGSTGSRPPTERSTSTPTSGT
jgi:aspartate/methionine/tyrosine aminotransferase